MASIIEGYVYDIFISYRQKDNKGDRWVSEFVEALRTELESTLKEEVSVYFDINPHDGLLDTHDVDASLKEKLKCAVFVPIISRTYCDPKSFAWVHEFQAFIEQSSKDRYGLKVKLAGGNVANRVLPVMIHDLDPEDKKLVENELGGFIRGIDFIYKEPGINKPLKPDDDEKKNINKTKYGYQVNKVANAIREIINGMKNSYEFEKVIPVKPFKKITPPAKNTTTKVLVRILIPAILLISGYLLFQQLIKPAWHIEKSIAILPFDNWSDDPSQESMSAGLTDAIINHLYKIKSIDRVATMQSVVKYKGSVENPHKIASELKVNYLVKGNYKKYGEKVRVSVYLIDPKKDKYLWTNDYDTTYSATDVITIQSDIALKIADQLKANLTLEESRNILRIGTINIKAFEDYQKAKLLLGLSSNANFAAQVDSGLKYSQKAFDLDPNYADAYAYTGMFWIMKGGDFGAGGLNFKDVVPEATRYAEKALKIDQNCAIAYTILGLVDFYSNWDFISAEDNFQKAVSIEPNSFYPKYCLVEFMVKMGNYMDALSAINICYKNSIPLDENNYILSNIRIGDIKRAIGSVYKFQFPTDSKDLFLGERYAWLNKYDSVIYYLNKGRLSNPNLSIVPKFQSYLAIAYHKTGEFQKSQLILEQLKEKSRFTSIGSSDFFISGYYSMTDQKDSALVWLERAFKTRSPEITWLKAYPIFDNLRYDPHYLNLYKRAGFEAYDNYKAGHK